MHPVFEETITEVNRALEKDLYIPSNTEFKSQKTQRRKVSSVLRESVLYQLSYLDSVMCSIRKSPSSLYFRQRITKEMDQEREQQILRNLKVGISAKKQDAFELEERMKSKDSVAEFKQAQRKISQQVLEITGGKLQSLKPTSKVLFIASPKVYSRPFLKKNPALDL